MKKENRLFISYAKEDLFEVNLISFHLSLQNIRCDYWDKSKTPGKREWDQIFSWIERDRYFTIIVTKNSIKSPSVNQEIGYAKSHASQIIPFQLEEANHRELGLLQGIVPIKVSRKELTKGAKSLANVIMNQEQQKAYKEYVERMQRQIQVYLSQQKIEESRKKESETFWGGVITGVVLAVVIIALWPKNN